MKTDTTEMITPPQLAKRWGVAPDKVLALIHSGELVAVNLAINPRGKRARWRVSLTEVERFEEARSSKPPAPKTRRRRRTPSTIREFF